MLKSLQDRSFSFESIFRDVTKTGDEEQDEGLDNQKNGTNQRLVIIINEVTDGARGQARFCSHFSFSCFPRSFTIPRFSNIRF